MTPLLKYYIWDIETYPNCFLFSGKFEGDPRVQTFEISTRKNQRTELLNWLSYLQNSQFYMVGYNNLGFDYPIIHELLNNIHTFGFEAAYLACQNIINQPYGRPLNQIQLKDRIIPQIDLMKINHFDNPNRRTSLKALQFAMRSASVEDLPFEPGTVLVDWQMDFMIQYNIHDITETEAFLKICKNLIEMRKELLDNGVLKGDVLNFSDVKIGAEYLIAKIGRAKCFMGNKPRQTFRTEIDFNQIILPKIEYRTEPFQKVLEWFKAQKVYNHPDAENPKLEAKLAGLDFHFGVGGTHASVESKSYKSNESHTIVDLDVTGMYPSIAIANGFRPEHLGQDFSDAYRQLVADRNQYKKGTSMNAVLKLASNGAFGKGDDKYSCFYDPKFPKEITVNGQLQILQLVEFISLIPGVQIIQTNTDGITAFIPREIEYLLDIWSSDWEVQTGLRLEKVHYKAMWIRDVNNYLAITMEGKIKRKGAYWYPTELKEYEGVWNKDFSMMVVQKVIEQSLINDWNPEALIRVMTDPFDFMIRYKTPAGAKIFIGDKEMLKTVRYYVSTKGQPMKKVALPKGKVGDFKRKNSLKDEYYNQILSTLPPGTWDARIHTANKSKYEIVTTSIESKWLVKECNKATDFNWENLNYDYYLEEIKKLEIS